MEREVRPRCPLEPDGVHLYELKDVACAHCGLLETYYGDEEFEESDEEVARPVPAE
jgi:hypothetical protein